MSTGLSLYQHLPHSLQSIAVQVYGYRESRRRYGARFDEIYAASLESEWWSSSRIEQYRRKRLREILEVAAKDVPFYGSDSPRAPDTSASEFKLLDGLPIIDKRLMLEAGDGIFNSRLGSRDYVTRHTSGTTGTPLTVRRSRDAETLHWATAWRHRARFGLEAQVFHANFTGKPVVPLHRQSPPYWHVCQPLRQLTIGMQHITGPKIRSIIGALDDYDVSAIIGYPSIIARVATLAAAEDVRMSTRIRGVFTSAEPLQAWQRQAIEDYFEAPVSERYGQVELCGVASQCEVGLYHEDFELGILEVLPTGDTEDGLRVANVICTSLANHAMPLIRYRTGDQVLFDPLQPPCACGRQSRTFQRFLGRSEDYVETPEGTRLRRFDYLFKDIDNLLAAQVVQRQAGRVQIRLWKRDETRDIDTRRLRRNVVQWISPTIEVDFVFAEDKADLTGGKFRPVVSNLSSPDDGQSA